MNEFLGDTLVLVLVDDGLCSRSFYTPISDSVQYLSSRFLKALVDDVSITCCGSAFQLLAAKNILRAVVVHLGTNSFIECPRKMTSLKAIPLLRQTLP